MILNIFLEGKESLFSESEITLIKKGSKDFALL